ncbi:Uncharacterised protein [BD1-7 clade bacterium]|uniref:Uncharacterized protein n=1 Tax=BD1-7 clade bacterium TaxID=2029982 RepID=A0A5S9N165_9GAMM|nr:Uncharacterised protein [BD1-7 clade bacterium]CAA0083373.1 Uncharacterised protein [BD1-7 clade bacterium]
MLTISLQRLLVEASLEEITVHSLDPCLYTITAVIDGHYYRVVDESGRPYRRFSLEKVRKDLIGCGAQKICLLQTTAYDEMIGGPAKSSVFSNALHLDTRWGPEA